MADIDSSAWDGNRAMSACQTASDYNSICAGKTAGDPALRSSHKLPHHYLGKPPNAAGVRAALQRFSQTQGLTNREAARSHLEAHMTTIQNQSANSAPPRDDLVRAVDPSGLTLRHDDGSPPTLVGHFAVFNEFTEIDSIFEGHFMERIAPGAFSRTFAEKGPSVKVTLNHGKDPDLGDKPLGIPSVLEEDEEGARYEVPLFDGIPPLVMSGLRAGAYGSSFRFRVLREEFDHDPEPSAANPEGLPERTITEVELYEFGPVTFPAYAGATAGVRSMTDEFVFQRLSHGEALAKFAEFVRTTGSAEEKPSEEKPRNVPEPPARIPRHAEWMRQREAQARS